MDAAPPDTTEGLLYALPEDRYVGGAGDVAHLQRMTGGSPLCLTQYFRLGQETGQWVTDSRSLFRSSRDIRKVVETIVRGRLALLDDTATRLWSSAPPKERYFTPTIVEQIADLPRGEVREKLYEASVNTRLIVLDEMSL